VPDLPSDVVDASKPAVVELTAMGLEVVSRVSACVALETGAVPRVVPVGSVGRLNVIPSSAVVVFVLLMLPGMLAVAVKDGCSGGVQVEFASEPSLVEYVRASLVGICVPEPCEVIEAVTTLDVRACVRFTAASVTELYKEKATVPKSSTDDLTLETYTVENVAVTVADAAGRLKGVCVPFV
jgi:hypothetical protein